MARTHYASGAGDTFAVPGVDGDYELPPAATYEVYTARTGGSHHTDLLSHAGAPVTNITPDVNGRAMFFGVDDYDGEYWVDAGGSDRYRVHPDGMAERIIALEGGSGGGTLPDGDYGAITVSASGTAMAIDANAVGTTQIADNAVTNAKLADNAVGNAELADNAVGTAEIAASAITTAKIADSQITNAKMADNAVGTAEIADGAVTTAKLAGGSLATLPAYVPFFVVKTAGVWGARPTNEAARFTVWIGADPPPAIVTSGTAGMYEGDVQIVKP